MFIISVNILELFRNSGVFILRKKMRTIATNIVKYLTAGIFKYCPSIIELHFLITLLLCLFIGNKIKNRNPAVHNFGSEILKLKIYFKKTC